jgi:hypothetical protein
LASGSRPRATRQLMLNEKPRRSRPLSAPPVSLDAFLQASR